LTLQWADHILPKLRGFAKAYFAPGRFSEHADGKATFVVPATMPMAKCEQFRGDVEAALAAHFGRPIPMRLVADQPEPPKRGSGSNNDLPTYEEEYYDPSELVDAPPGGAPATGADRLLEAFPGAELLDEKE
jgi:DNA polymerase III subunit gamma/tau